MRLIDADKLLEETRRDRDYARKNGFLDMYYERQVLIDRIKAQPTAYDPEKVVEQLEELKAIKSDGFTDDLLNMGFTKGYSKALDDIESEFLKCEKVHYNLQDILCVINKLKAGDRE